jgi:heme-degrading monooxygenase HmoA
MTFCLFEYNIARLRHPIDSPENTEFVTVLEAVNLIAEVTPGFIWRLTDADNRSATYVQVYDDPRLIVNFSAWENLEALRHFTYRSGHSVYLRRRREWFEEGSSAIVCWWGQEGCIPDLDVAQAKLELLQSRGPSSDAFTLSRSFDVNGTPLFGVGQNSGDEPLADTAALRGQLP